MRAIAIAAVATAAFLVAIAQSNEALGQTPQPEPEAAPAQALTFESILARLRRRETELGLLTRGAGDPVLTQAEIPPQGMILATPVQYARVGYLQRKIRIANTDHSVEPGAPVFATAAPLAEQTDDAARPHRWCVRVAEGQPLRIVPRCSEELTSIVVEDPAAASALPAMEVVYSFVRWRGEFAVLEHGVRIDGQIVERSEVRLEREEDGSAILWEGGGEVRLRPGLNRRSAVATLVEPFETEDELRGAAGAISGNVRLQPAALTVSFGPSADRPAQFATPPQIFAEIPAATHYIRAYPAPAMERRLEGDTRLACVIRPSRRLRCIVLTETPAGRGFGLAALRISHEFRIVERLPDGRSTIGGALQIPIRFRLSN